MRALNLYQKNGYIDVKSILNYSEAQNLPYIFIIGGRGTGKTFTTLKYMIENKYLFVYLRRKQTQCDIINKQEFSPFRPIAKMIKKEIVSAPITKYNAGFYYGEYDAEKQKYIPCGEPLCYTASLTTIANLRSIGIVDDCKYLIYDEFIPEKQEAAIKNEGLAFLNCVETIGRNREMQGQKPLTVICLANAMDIGNPIFAELDLIDYVDRMELKSHSYGVIRERGILIVRLINSPISKQKQETSLYKLTKGTEFFDMSVANYFAFEEKGNIKGMPLNEFILDLQVSDIYIYKHKSLRCFYCSTHKNGSTKNVYGDTQIELIRFKTERPDIWTAYVFNELFFDRYATEIKFKKLNKIRRAAS